MPARTFGEVSSIHVTQYQTPIVPLSPTTHSQTHKSTTLHRPLPTPKNLNQAHRRPSRHTPYNHHLRAPSTSRPCLPPPGINTRLHKPKPEQRHDHHPHGPHQPLHHVVLRNQEIRHQRHEAAYEIAQRDRQRAGQGARRRGLGERVREAHQEGGGVRGGGEVRC